jgi:FtsP/CotA-like multicopper oxidase with cupredoxin domain
MLVARRWRVLAEALPMLQVSRRAALQAIAGLAAAPVLSPLRLRSAERSPAKVFTLRAAPARAAIAGSSSPATEVWCYNGVVPGPELRARQGDRVRIVVENGLTQGTTVHWHGLRVPHAMDGVPDVTQPPIAPRGRFTYEFDLPDAGTFWYHPHTHSPMQVEMGLAGAFIVEEREPMQVDRDVTWVLDDWRLDRNGQVAGGFGAFMDASHAGRIGNVLTINGRPPVPLEVRAGERIRLRLINVANARIFALSFDAHAPRVIAYDGQPCGPHELFNGRTLLGPGMRTDLVLDMTGKPGQTFAIADAFAARSTRIATITYRDEAPLRAKPLDTPINLAPNPIPEPDLARADRHDVVFRGGMMGGMGGMGGMGRRGTVWSINGHSATEEDHAHEPFLSLKLERTAVITLRNETAWWHPIHLHGHSFRIIGWNGQPTRLRPWADTALLAPRERAELAFVADNPGDWMFHCHVLEHQASGMMGVVRVA